MKIEMTIRTENKLLVMELLDCLEKNTKTIKMIKETINMTQNGIDEAKKTIETCDDESEIRMKQHYIDEREMRLEQLKKQYESALQTIPSVELKLGSLID